MRNNISYFILTSLLTLLVACEPYQVADVALPTAPTADFSMEVVPDNPNQIVVTDQSSGNFSRVWDFGNGGVSTLPSDTAFYSLKGEYTITLAVAGDGGTGVTTRTVTIEEDAAVACDSTTLLLAGGCGADDSKTWIWAQDAGAVSVGPTPTSSEWYGSPEAGLVSEQYDDSWTFAFSGTDFVYENNGQSVNPYNGYVAEDFTPPAGTWRIEAGAGIDGTDRMTISDEDLFLGVMDSGPVYDIFELTEDRLVLVSPIMQEDGTPGQGYFTLYFVAQ